MNAFRPVRPVSRLFAVPRRASSICRAGFAAVGRVVSHPGILGGKATFTGTRVPVDALFDYLADGLSLDYFLESFPSVTREEAVADFGELSRAMPRYGQERINGELTL
jgi:uncharacterized protein (DUF433 family)